MASVVDDLNDLLARERGEVEAVEALLEELRRTDADLAESGSDVLTTASWSCSGLYHRIVQLNGVPTVDSSDLAQDILDRPDTQSKLEFLCAEQQQDLNKIRGVLKHKGLDKTTREFIEELRDAHRETVRWCEAALSQWKADI